ncbi:MAG: hypothetical protein ACWGQW_15075, partial [bacterium]
VTEYLEAGFARVFGITELHGYALSHIPLHTDSVTRWKGNIHGHLHHGRVWNSEPRSFSVLKSLDTRYYNVSAEILQYVPHKFQDIINWY